jgi:hypothetical protein
MLSEYAFTRGVRNHVRFFEYIEHSRTTGVEWRNAAHSMFPLGVRKFGTADRDAVAAPTAVPAVAVATTSVINRLLHNVTTSLRPSLRNATADSKAEARTSSELSEAGLASLRRLTGGQCSGMTLEWTRPTKKALSVP